jgi:hypothetical protein
MSRKVYQVKRKFILKTYTMFLGKKFKMKKLGIKCTFCSFLCFLFFGCGKVVSKQEKKEQGNQELLLPGTIGVEASHLKDIYGPGETPVPFNERSIDGSFTFPALAEVAIPSNITVTAGGSSFDTAEIYFNAGSGTYDFYCLYQGDNSVSYDFVDCYDEEGDSLGIPAGFYTFIEEGKSVDVHLEGAIDNQDTDTFTAFQVDWK